MGNGGVSFEVGTPLPRTGKAWRPLAVTVLPGPLGTGRLRRPARWLRRGDHLGLQRLEARPGGPAALDGGRTEPGRIRGARPSESLAGLGPAPLPPAGRTASCRHRAAAAPRLGEPGEGARGARRRWGLARPGAPRLGPCTSCPGGAAPGGGGRNVAFPSRPPLANCPAESRGGFI